MIKEEREKAIANLINEANTQTLPWLLAKTLHSEQTIMFVIIVCPGGSTIRIQSQIPKSPGKVEHSDHADKSYGSSSKASHTTPAESALSQSLKKINKMKFWLLKQFLSQKKKLTIHRKNTEDLQTYTRKLTGKIRINIGHKWNNW